MASEEKKYLRVNWIDGMKINKDHFIASGNALLQELNIANQKRIQPLNYGLSPQYGSEDNSSIDVSISIDGQNSIQVILRKCIAVTLGGHSIQIDPKTVALLEQSGYILQHQYTINEDEDAWFIVIKVNPFITIPAGNADPEEIPPRHPHALPEYRLDVISEGETNTNELGLNHITIGKIIMINDTPTLDTDYIPPCTSIQSHPDLRFTHSELSAFLNQMENYSLHIIQKIHQKKQTNDLARMVLEISENTLHYLNGIIPEFRLIDKYEPPIVVITKMINLARTIKSSLDVFVGTGKEELLNYLTDWCDLNQGAFENVLIRIIDLDYIHTDINASLVNVSDFTKLMLSLFKKLNELDYIGKKSNSTIFVKEEAVENAKVKSRRSFLLD